MIKQRSKPLESNKKTTNPKEDRWFCFSHQGYYFTHVPGTLIWVLIGVRIWVLVAAKAVMLMDIAKRAAVATITSFFMVVLLHGEIVNLHL
jgi:hypothetical protein